MAMSLRCCLQPFAKGQTKTGQAGGGGVSKGEESAPGECLFRFNTPTFEKQPDKQLTVSIQIWPISFVQKSNSQPAATAPFVHLGTVCKNKKFTPNEPFVENQLRDRALGQSKRAKSCSVEIFRRLCNLQEIVRRLNIPFVTTKLDAQGKSPGTKIARNVSELCESFVQFLALPRKLPDWIPDSPLVHPSGRFIKAENL